MSAVGLKPRVLVTGAQGSLGRHVAAALAADYRLRLFDRSPPKFSVGDSETICGDLRKLPHVLDAASDCDAIVHLGAIPGNRPPGDQVIDTNVRGTFHVTAAAEYQRVRRLVFVSSEMALGFLGSWGKIRPEYLPIDEAHPLRPIDPYGLSKKIGEDLLDVFRRRTGAEAISIRPGFILNRWMAMATARRYGMAPDEWYGSLHIYTDADDLSEGIRDLLSLPRIDESVVWMAAPDNALGIPTLDLCAGDWTRDVRIDRAALTGTAALVRCDLARRLVGWDPKRLIGPQIETVRRTLNTAGR